MEAMCAACGSWQVRKFNAEANIHFPGHGGLAQPSVFVFPKFAICLNCGLMKSTLTETELRMLRVGPRSANHTAAA
jgi:hypothetical protein